MPVVWKLKKWLVVEHDIYRPSQLQSLLAEKAGVRLSLQAISALINGKPNALRFQTIQALCDALNCKLSDFCDVLPSTAAERQKRCKTVGGGPFRLYGKHDTTKGSTIDFPDPRKYIKREKNDDK
jgi:DNA-binding Xre family transcriptional regulator